MMFNLLVVEDEDMIRNKILNNVNWKFNGFQEVFDARDGLEALEVIKNNKVDIVITDIQMPGMNGIELIRRLKEMDEGIRTIVISGYAEFEYAKESIKLNVNDYVLKPFLSKNLLEIVNKVKEEIIREQREKVEVENLRTKLRENRKALREKLFCDLLNGNFIGNIENDLKYLDLTEFSSNSYFVAVINIDNLMDIIESKDEEQKYLCNLSLFSRLCEFFSGCFVINYKLDQIVVVCFDEAYYINPVFEELVGMVNMDLGLKVTIGIGNTYSNLKDMYISYKEASSAAMLGFLHGRGMVYGFNDMNFENRTYSRQLFSIVNNKLYDDLKIGAFDKIKKDIVDIIMDLKNARLGMDSVSTVVNNIILLSCKTINELGYNIVDIFGSEFNPYLDLRSVVGIARLEEWLFNFFFTINEYINKKRDSRNENLITAVKNYVDNNYCSNVNLTSLSKMFTISAGYLSILFNTYTGQNFIDYITGLRIQKAKELLKNSDLRIYEIAEKVGYRDAYYFSTAFKKAVGINPTDYRGSLDML